MRCQFCNHLKICSLDNIVNITIIYIKYNSIRSLSNPISVRDFVENFIDEIHIEDVNKIISKIERVLKLKAFW